jgi:hypothetical protein
MKLGFTKLKLLPLKQNYILRLIYFAFTHFKAHYFLCMGMGITQKS